MGNRRRTGGGMNRGAVIPVLLFAGVSLAAARVPPLVYVQAALVAVVFLVYWRAAGHPSRSIFLLCAGEPCVVVAGSTGWLPALAVQLVLVLVFLADTGSLSLPGFIVFAGVSSVLAFAARIPLHVPLPAVFLVAGIVVAVAVAMVAEFRITARLTGSEVT